MRILAWFFIMLSINTFASPAIEVVPNYDGYVNTMFPEVKQGQYSNYGIWGKIKYKLNQRNIRIYGSSLKEYLHRPEEAYDMLSEGGIKEDVRKIVVLNDPHRIKHGNSSFFPEEKLVLYMWEPPTVCPDLYDEEFHEGFSKIFTWDDDLVDNKKYFKMHYPVKYPMIQHITPFKKKKLCCLIARNKSSQYAKEIYSERRTAIEFFEGYYPEEFDLYGYGWDKDEYLSYKGSIQDKYKVLRNYRFSICFENTQDIKGYITEKIFDCFHVGCVPIYLGASNVTDYIPKECFIDMRDFSSYEELYQYIRGMGLREYNRYLSNIRKYLNSPRSEVFSEEYFVDQFIQEVAL